MDNQQFKNIYENILILLKHNQIDKVSQLLLKFNTVYGENPEFFILKARMLEKKGSLKQCKAAIKVGLESFPDSNVLIEEWIRTCNIENNVFEATEAQIYSNLYGHQRKIIVNEVNNENKEKILHGTMEIANQMRTVSNAQNMLGYQSETVNYYSSYLGFKSENQIYINEGMDFSKANRITKQFAAHAIQEFDIFHFHFNTTLTLDYSDIKIINQLGKKQLMQFWGSDVRMLSKAKAINPYVKVKFKNEDEIKQRLEIVSSSISNCIVDYELAEYVTPYFKKMHYVKSAIDLSLWNYKAYDIRKRKIKIVHAPSSPEFKGTQFILRAIETLKHKYEFDFQLVQGVSHEQAKKIYESADLIIDQLHFGTYGIFAIEAMALGKPVICWISDFMKDKLPKELPIIIANPDTILGVIEHTLKNKDQLLELSLAGRKYVEKHHDALIIGQQLLDIYKTL